MKSTIFVSAAFFAASALAQNSSYIPSGISSGCSSFLQTLNQDSSLATCTKSLLDATKAFSGGKGSSSDVGPALTNLCDSSDNACSNTATRGLLTQMMTACTDELMGSSPDPDVQLLYDVLYTFSPFRAAVCSKDSTTNNYCAAALGSTTPANSKRGDDPIVDPSKLRNTGAPFLFMLPSSSPAQLCTPCGKAILQSYVTWEARTPYATGLKQSPILSAQSSLWSAFNDKCGASFLSTITADSNAAPLAALAGGASPTQKPALTAFLGLAGLSVALLM